VVTVTAYQQVLETLFGLERGGGALGLRGIELLLHGLGHPQQRFHAVHVAGTNGKGSVCALAERILRVAGLRTGLYTSPHLVDFSERIRVGGRAIAHADVAAWLERIRAMPDAAGRTFFEVTTAIGFAHFAESRVEWVVAEVGLGGRLDSTNILRPRLSVVTDIGLDHVELLGRRLADVAREKAGILKPDTPVVAAVRRPAAAQVIARAAREQNAPLHDVARQFQATRVHLSPQGAEFRMTGRPWGSVDLRIGLRGRHAVRHALTAAAIAAELRAQGLPIHAEHVAEGLAAARWPGRLEPCPTDARLWWDGAHNVDGVDALVHAWADIGMPPPGAVVLACSRDKPVARMIKGLAPLARGKTIVCTQASSERATPAAELAAAARDLGLRAREAPTVEEALASVLGRARPPVLLCGSLFLVGDAMRVTDSAPPEAL